MGLTATRLGHELGRSAREVNTLLKAHGFMEGDPGAYRPTKLGQAFAHAHDFDNGYGGFAHRQWGFLSWDPGILDSLRSSMASNPNGVLAAAVSQPAPAAASAIPAAAAVRSSGAGALAVRHPWVTGLVAAGVTVAVPAVHRAWAKRRRAVTTGAQVRSHEQEPAQTTDAAGTKPADETGPAEQ